MTADVYAWSEATLGPQFLLRAYRVPGAGLSGLLSKKRFSVMYITSCRTELR